MAFGGFGKARAAAPMAEINMIPLIDVMLVLLAIFIITAPLLTHAVKIDLPRASSRPEPTRVESIHLGVRVPDGFTDAAGTQQRLRMPGVLHSANRFGDIPRA